MSGAKMPSACRDGRAEMHRADQILERQLPARLRKRLVPVPSPGRASLVILLYESGCRGADLDYGAMDEAWEILAGGSSSFPGEGFVIHADGQSSQVYLGTFLPKLYKEWGERPGTPSWPHEPCVVIDKHNESVTYFGEPVELEPQQYAILLAIVELSGEKGGAVRNVDLYASVTIAEGTDLRPPVSRIRHALKAAAKGLRDALQNAAIALVDELIPRRRTALGYRIGRSELFSVR